MTATEKNEGAAHYVDLAFDCIRDFRRTKRREHLQAAVMQLKHARDEDPDFLPALYGEAVVEDLSGHAVDAIAMLQNVLARNPPFGDEAEYQLGLAYYHRYDLESLGNAIKHLEAVIHRTNDPALQCQARVTLLQAYGMQMIPRNPTQPDLKLIEHSFRRVLKEGELLTAALDGLEVSDPLLLPEMRASCLNAEALARMYWSDFCGTTAEKLARLNEALHRLERADELNPADWATQCDLGSTRMRLGYWRKSPQEFVRARDHLTRVTESLRPDYGFALYEIGRIWRLEGDFEQALAFFDRALAVPGEYRDVSSRRIGVEQLRAREASRVYP